MHGDLLLTSETLTSETGVKPGDRVIVGFSGGADSVTLLLTLRELGLEVIAAHFDHQIRAESAADADWVRAFCAQRGIRVTVDSADVTAAARSSGTSLEDTARRLRYRFLFALAEREKSAAVAVGHHADDQAETILAHFLRGSGLDGLSGMTGRLISDEWSASIPLIRPLLKIRRREIEVWLKTRRIEPLVDRTNDDTRFSRNRIRHELIPCLEATYNPNLIETLTRCAETVRTDRAFLDDMGTRAYADCLLNASAERIRLNRERYLAQPAAIRARIIRLAVNRLGGLRDGLTNALILRAADFFEDLPAQDCPILCCSDWSEGRYLFAIGSEIGMTVGPPDSEDFYDRYYPFLRINSEADEMSGIPVRSPESVQIGNGRFSIQPVQMSDALGLADAVAEMRRDRFTVYLDADRIHGSLTVRPRRKGERFAPFGIGGKTVLIEDFFLNGKVPAEVRGRYPIVYDESGALWVVGLRTADRAALTETTRRALRLNWTLAAAENENAAIA